MLYSLLPEIKNTPLFTGVSEEHVKYYEEKGKATHIWGTHFPVRLESNDKNWLCPVCGEFNSVEEKVCAGCKTKILK